MANWLGVYSMNKFRKGWVGDWRKPGKHKANWAGYNHIEWSVYSNYIYHIFLQSKKKGYAVKFHHDIIFNAPTMEACFEFANEHIIMQKLQMNLEDNDV